MENWIETRYYLPPENILVNTKLHDEYGERNEQPLIRFGGLWFLPDKSMYVYYTPTHWMEVSQ